MVVKASNSPLEIPEQEKDLFHLWGIDGALAGNEGRMHGCLPFLTRDGEVLAARALDWDPSTGENLYRFSSEEEAAQFGAKLLLPQETAISPGQLVVLFGPELMRKVLIVDEPPLTEWIEEKISVQEGFRIACLKAADFERLANDISETAKRVFDREIQRLGADRFSDRAAAALWVLRNTGYTPVYDQAIRALIAERVQQKPDRYRKTLKLMAARLKQNPEVLEQETKRHLDLLLQSAANKKALANLTDLPLPRHTSTEISKKRVSRSLSQGKYRTLLDIAGKPSKKARKPEAERS